MADYLTEVLSPLTILTIGLVFGFFIGMLWYYPKIEALKAKIRKFLKRN